MVIEYGKKMGLSLLLVYYTIVYFVVIFNTLIMVLVRLKRTSEKK